MPAGAARRGGPEGERKQVTVLFVDVVGSMDLADRMDAEEWGDLMERFFAVLRTGVNRFDGRIDKFTGDGVMALFGAPVAYEDHARRACGAALHLRDALGAFGREFEHDRGLPFAARMGLNSGEVVAGSVGEDLNVEYTAVGNTVGLAQRMESLARPGTIYLTAPTAALAGGYFTLDDLGPMRPKGVRTPMGVFELVGPGPLRTALDVAATKGFSRFVGRDRDMAILDRAFTEACNSNGQVVGMVGEAGLGKSRLCHEFAESCRVRGVDVFAAHALAHTRSVPFVPVLELLRAQFGIGDHDDPGVTRAKVAATVRQFDDPSLDDDLSLLWDFLGVADPDAPAMAMDAEARQRRIFGVLNRLRRARSVRGPFVIVVEDLHWLDPGSETFLENLVNGVPGNRLLVVTTFRPEYRAPWAHRSHYGQHALLPLAGPAADELLGDLLGRHPSLDGVAELVRDRTGGNPFFIEEVVQGLVEQGRLHGRRGGYELADTIDELRIPATVQAVLAARVDRLSERDKALLQTAAVIGRQFSRRVVSRVSGLSDTDLDAALGALMEAEFIYEAATSEDEYTFKHALTEEMAYGSQLAKRRARIHTTVAATLATIDPDKLEERSSLIAGHYELGGALLEAARWNARAGTWAGFRNPTEATRHWRRVRTLTDRLGPSPEANELAIKARLQLLSLYWRLGAASEDGPTPFEDEAATLFTEAQTFADNTGQTAVKALVLTVYGHGAVRLLSDAIEAGYELNLQAVRLADATGDPALRAVARVGAAWGLFILGRIREAADVARQMLPILGPQRSAGRGTVVTSPYTWCRMQVAHFSAYFERLDDGLAALQPVIDLAREEGDLETEAWAHRHCAVFADLAGTDPDVAARHAAQGLQRAEEAGGAWSRIFVREGVAINHAQRGEWRQAIDVVDEALAIARDRRLARADMPLLLTIRARAQIGIGDIPGARSSAEEATAVAVRCGTRFYEAQARLQLARAMLAGPHPADEPSARAELDQALNIVQAQGIRSYSPYIHLELAHLARSVGNQAAYHEGLSRAHRLFLDVGAHGRAQELASLVHSP
jgi:adenylate cyclase